MRVDHRKTIFVVGSVLLAGIALAGCSSPEESNDAAAAGVSDLGAQAAEPATGGTDRNPAKPDTAKAPDLIAERGDLRLELRDPRVRIVRHHVPQPTMGPLHPHGPGPTASLRDGARIAWVTDDCV